MFTVREMMNCLSELLRVSTIRVPAIVFFLLTALQAFFAPLDYGIYHDKTPDGLDKVVIVKLVLALLCFGCGVWGVFSFSSVRSFLGSIWGMLFAALVGLMLLGATSGLAVEAVPMSLITYTYFVFVATAIHVLGFRVYSLAIVSGIAVAGIMALFLFYLVPTTGVFWESISMTQTVARLGGIAHPNSVARSIVLGGILSLFLFRARELPLGKFLLLFALFGYAALLAKSRTALVAGVAAAFVLYLDKWMTRAGMALAVIMLVMGLGGVFLLFATGGEDSLASKLLGTISKSGDKSEIMTATGRSLIWARTVELVAERPLVGYGMNSATKLLREHSQSTHNAILNAALCGGLFAGLIMLMFFIRLGWDVLNSPHLGIRALSMFLFLSWITEDTVLDMFPGPATLVWFACVAAPAMTGTLRTAHCQIS